MKDGASHVTLYAKVPDEEKLLEYAYALWFVELNIMAALNGEPAPDAKEILQDPVVLEITAPEVALT